MLCCITIRQSSLSDTLTCLFRRSSAMAIFSFSNVAGDDKLRDFADAMDEFSSHCPSHPLTHPLPKTRPCCTSLPSYTALMKSFGRSGLPDMAYGLLQELKSSPPLSPNVYHYNTVMNSFFLSGRLGDAQDVFDEMLATGIYPNVCSFTIFMKIRSSHPCHIDSARDIIRIMERYGTIPDSVTYLALVNGLHRFGRFEEARGVLGSMIKRGCTPTNKNYTLILHGYCSQGKIEEAKSWIHMMENLGYRPDRVAFSILIKGLCKVGNFEEIEMLLKDSSISKSWRPNQITYNTYLNGLCKWGKIDEAFRQYEVMRASGLRPNVMTLNILFCCLCRDSKLQEAKLFLERSCQLGWNFDVFFYNTLMSQLCNMGFLSSVLKLLTILVKQGISPNAFTITIVIRSLCMSGKARKAVRIISSEGFEPDIVAFNTLIHWLSILGMVDVLQYVDYLMCIRNVTPNEFTYCLMIDNLCRGGHFIEAINYFVERLVDGFWPRLAKRFAFWMKKGSRRRGIHGWGLIEDSNVFELIINRFCEKGFCKNAHIFKVCSTIDEMLGIR